jgi:hypothetical protein
MRSFGPSPDCCDIPLEYKPLNQFGHMINFEGNGYRA